MKIHRNDHKQVKACFITNKTQVSGPQRSTYLRTSLITYVESTRQNTWNAKKCVLEDLMGLTKESYAKLTMYCHNMGAINHGLTLFIKMEGENHFQVFLHNSWTIYLGI